MSTLGIRFYAGTFFRTFCVAALFKFVMDKYLFNQEFEIYGFLFMCTLLAMVMTWQAARRKNKQDKAGL